MDKACAINMLEAAKQDPQILAILADALAEEDDAETIRAVLEKAIRFREPVLLALNLEDALRSHPVLSISTIIATIEAVAWRLRLHGPDDRPDLSRLAIRDLVACSWQGLLAVGLPLGAANELEIFLGSLGLQLADSRQSRDDSSRWTMSSVKDKVVSVNKPPNAVVGF
jgi:hypothetical protein